ncbi:MAG: hypothetical protein ACI3U2_06960 [Anaerovibrio sp.]
MLYDLPKPKDGEVFCEFNVNPKKIKTGDCSIRAVALAFDIPYDKAYRELCNFGIEMSREFMSAHCIGTYLNTKAVALTRCYGETLYDFAAKHPSGRFVLCVRAKESDRSSPDHIVCCIDGVIYDIFNSTPGIVCHAWQVYLREEELLYDVLVGIKDAATKPYKDNEDCFTALEMKELLNYRRMLERDLHNMELHMEGIL